MFWKFGKTLSITNRLLLIFLSSILLILLVITGLIYPPLKALLHHARLNNDHYNFLLTQICIKKFFIALWISTAVFVIAIYLIAKHSLKPIKKFTEKLAMIEESSLDQRLSLEGNPKELQQLANTCNEMLSRIENAFTTTKQFSASMAHELRTPIHYLRNATEITLAKPQSTETYQQVLQSHLNEYENLTYLLDNLLFLVRSEQKHLCLKLESLSAKALIDSVIEYYDGLAQENNIQLHVHGDALIKVDKHLFKRVIANLIDNGLKYSLPGRNIIITIQTLTNKSTTICIADNGIGIAKQHLSFLCQGFYRVNNKESRGLGLGLAIATSIMENHNGKLVVDSQLGLGTSILLKLKSE